MKWDPTVLEEDAERSLFRYKTKVIKKTMKPELVQEFEEIDEILGKNCSGKLTEIPRSGQM